MKTIQEVPNSNHKQYNSTDAIVSSFLMNPTKVTYKNKQETPKKYRRKYNFENTNEKIIRAPIKPINYV